MNTIIFIWLTALTVATWYGFSEKRNENVPIRKLPKLPFLPTEHAEFLRGNRVEEIFRNNQNASIDDVLA